MKFLIFICFVLIGSLSSMALAAPESVQILSCKVRVGLDEKPYLVKLVYDIPKQRASGLAIKYHPPVVAGDYAIPEYCNITLSFVANFSVDVFDKNRRSVLAQTGSGLVHTARQIVPQNHTCISPNDYQVKQGETEWGSMRIGEFPITLFGKSYAISIDAFSQIETRSEGPGVVLSSAWKHHRGPSYQLGEVFWAEVPRKGNWRLYGCYMTAN